MNRIFVLLTIVMATHVAHPVTNAQTPAAQPKVVEQGIKWSCDRVAVIEYFPARNQIVVNYVDVKVAQVEYERLRIKNQRSEQEQRLFSALGTAVGTFLGIRETKRCLEG